MTNALLNTTSIAGLVRRDKTVIYQWFNEPACEGIFPERAGIGETRWFTPNQALLAMLMGDLNRWGVPVPFAGKIACRIGETLYFNPGVDRVVISFHENGASFFVADDGDGELLTEGNGAGAMRFRVEFDLTAYRAAISAAIEEAQRDRAA